MSGGGGGGGGGGGRYTHADHEKRGSAERNYIFFQPLQVLSWPKNKSNNTMEVSPPTDLPLKTY